ncbi:hypothetical protein Q8W13_18740 [Photobacterium damselae subsp. piscicida]|nr:hypothetical protein [Photobacterium damselae subsp. piscicida]
MANIPLFMPANHGNRWHFYRYFLSFSRLKLHGALLIPLLWFIETFC